MVQLSSTVGHCTSPSAAVLRAATAAILSRECAALKARISDASIPSGVGPGPPGTVRADRLAQLGAARVTIRSEGGGRLFEELVQHVGSSPGFDEDAKRWEAAYHHEGGE